MTLRIDPFRSLLGSFRGIPFNIGKLANGGGRRGQQHEYPDRDVPYFEDLGRKSRAFNVGCYFVGPLARIEASAFVKALEAAGPGLLIHPTRGSLQVAVGPYTESYDDRKTDYVEFSVTFLEAGSNSFPASSTSWPHTLLAAVGDATSAITDALGSALDLGDFGQQAIDGLLGQGASLGLVLNVAASLAAGQSPSTALASAALLTAGYVGGLGDVLGPSLDVVSFAASTTALIAGWAGALLGPSPDNAARNRAVDALWYVYDDDTWSPPPVSTTDDTLADNQGAYAAAVRRSAVAEIGRQAASLAFASYDDAIALRARMATAFDAEISVAGNPLAPGGRDDGARAALVTVRAAALNAVSAAGADKARLVPYRLPGPRPSRALAQLWYPDDRNVVSRAAELVARTGAIHPAFLPPAAERLSN